VEALPVYFGGGFGIRGVFGWPIGRDWLGWPEPRLSTRLDWSGVDGVGLEPEQPMSEPDPAMSETVKRRVLMAMTQRGDGAKRLVASQLSMTTSPPARVCRAARMFALA
jgi:hypothetical protein